MSDSVKKSDPILLSLLVCFAVAVQCVLAPLHATLMKEHAAGAELPFPLVLCSVLAQEASPDSTGTGPEEDAPGRFSPLSDSCPICSALILAQLAALALAFLLLLPDARSLRIRLRSEEVLQRKTASTFHSVRAPPIPSL